MTGRAGVVSVSFTLFLVGVLDFKGNKKPCHLFGSRAEKNRVILFSFALPASRPYLGGVQVLSNECGYEAVWKKSYLGWARGKNAGLFRHHSVAHQHGARNLHRNEDMSNAVENSPRWAAFEKERESHATQHTLAHSTERTPAHHEKCKLDTGQEMAHVYQTWTDHSETSLYRRVRVRGDSLRMLGRTTHDLQVNIIRRHRNDLAAPARLTSATLTIQN